MSNDLNQCNFTGRLVADCEQIFTQSGTSKVSFKIAVNKSWKKDGEKKDFTEFIPIVNWGKLGEAVSAYLTKGKQVRVTGEFKTDQYEKDGEKKYFTHINASEIQLLGSRSESQGEPNNQPSGDQIPF